MPTELQRRTDEGFMREALTLAEHAASRGEVPVGALLVHGERIIGRGWNQPIVQHDPTAHAEIMALRDAAASVKNYRLPETTLYVTIEPCTMCAGAIVHARVQRVIFGAREPRAGVAVSNGEIFSSGYFNHQVEVQGGILEKECAQLMKEFFSARRRGVGRNS